MNQHEIANQRILSEFVARQSLTCFSSAFESIRELAVKAEDYALLDAMADCRVRYDHETACREDDWEPVMEDGSIVSFVNTATDDTSGATEWYDLADMESIDPHESEALEFWLVNEQFGHELAEYGEAVLFDFMGGLCVWGRTTSGQAIMLDGVVREIASSMEILVGQKNAWEA